MLNKPDRIKPKLQKIRRLLVHAPNWVGDHAMAFPFYAALGEVFENAEITLVGRAWVSDLKPPGLSEVIAFAGKKLPDANAQRLRERAFDIGFTLSPSFRSAWLLRSLKVARRHGFNSDARSLLLTREKNSFRRQRYNRGEHRSLAYLRLLTPYLTRAVLPEDLFAKHRDTQLAPLPIHTIEQKFSLKKSVQRVLVCPGSTAASKKYPIGHFIAAIESAARKMPKAEFVLLGAAIDSAECAAIAAHFTRSKTRVVSLAAKTTLAEAHALIAYANAVVANDSGLAHIASLTRTPLVTFNGMGNRFETSPLARNKAFFDLDLPCSPCFKKECPRRDFSLACLTGIAPAVVADSIVAALRRGRV